MEPQLQIPGYAYDPEKKRYFKLTPDQAKAKRRLEKLERHENRKVNKAKRRKGGDGPESTHDRSTERPSTGPSKLERNNHNVLVVETLLEQRRLRPASAWKAPASAHALEGLALASSQRHITFMPDMIMTDENVSALHVNQETIRIGGAGGSLAHSRWLKDDPDIFMQWHQDWTLSGPVTSIREHNGHYLASSLGPSPGAFYCKDEVHASLSAKVFRPPKTSIWTSYLDGETLALGGDQSVFLPIDASQHDLGSVPTRSAVFSLARHQNRVLAGTRSGDVLGIDSRSAKTSPAQTKSNQQSAQTVMKLGSSVLHMRCIQDWQLLASCMDGSMGLYDLRSKLVPIFSLKGHINTYTKDVGFDVWNDSMVAAAGSDNRVRLWSLETGKQLTAENSSDGLAAEDFQEPVKALSFQHGAPSPILHIASGPCICTYRV